MSTFSKVSALLFATLAGLLISSKLAFASGTPVNTPISNTATLAYDISGIVQLATTSPAATFVVDRKINLTVDETDNAPAIVASGQSLAVTTFRVTNTGNDSQDFNLVAANLPNGTLIFNNLGPFSDSFDATGCAAFVKSSPVLNGYTSGVELDPF